MSITFHYWPICFDEEEAALKFIESKLKSYKKRFFYLKKLILIFHMKKSVVQEMLKQRVI